MIIQNIGTRAISMYIDSDELSELGLSPDSIGQQEASELLKKALDDRAIKQWDAAEMEVYPGKDSLLLFVRRKSAKPYYYIFTDLECLITACSVCRPMPSSLLCCPEDEGSYLLTVFPLEGDNPPAILSEFASQVELSPYQAIHYDEQSEYILSHNAIAVIRQFFCG
ncbi:MAG: hypothetical protein ACRDBM_12025 [Sporomusa sp.]